MNDITNQGQAGHPGTPHDLDRARRRESLKAKHTQSLVRLMEDRDDLRGVHPLADLVDDAVRWSA